MTTTADYPVRAEAITEEKRFAHNELVEILDANGRPTGKRGYFFAQEIDLFSQPTGRAAVATIGGPNILVSYKQLRSVKH